MLKFLVFAGTTEGRAVLELLAQYPCTLCASVATEYGGQALPPLEGLTVLTGRLDATAMTELLAGHAFTGVFDATHPYATEATENIRAACAQTATPYVRVLRQKSERQGAVYFTTAAAVADYLCTVPGNILLTTGSKELDAFTRIPAYQERVYPRVLPTEESLSRCLSLGFSPKNILCMQGPFCEELNFALLQQLNATLLVTKDSGTAGGFLEKCTAAARAGAELIVIGRPPQEEGCALEGLPELLEKRFCLAPRSLPQAENAPYFPLFVSLHGKAVVVVGAGRIALRRVRALLPFGCCITVLAPEAAPELTALAAEGKLKLHLRGYTAGDCAGAALVVAATDSRTVNHRVFEECLAQNIPISVADCKEESSFYFPGIAREGCVVAGVTASGENHALAKKITEQLRAELKRSLFLQNEEEAK